jgi:hypothetical protein
MTKTNWPFIPADMLEITAADGVTSVTAGSGWLNA